MKGQCTLGLWLQW